MNDIRMKTPFFLNTVENAVIKLVAILYRLRNSLVSMTLSPLQWRHNEHDGLLNQQPYDCSLIRLFRQFKENIQIPRHWPLRGEITGDRWIPRTNGQ